MRSKLLVWAAAGTKPQWQVAIWLYIGRVERKAKNQRDEEKRWALSVNWLFCSALSSSFSLFGECLITGLEDSERVTVLDDIQEQEHTSTHTHKHSTHTYTCKLTLFFNLEVWICTKATHRPNHNRSQVLTSSIHTQTPTKALAQGRKTLLCLYMPSWPSACRCVIDKPLLPLLPLECKNRKSKTCVPPWVQIKKCPLLLCHMAKVRERVGEEKGRRGLT